MKFKEPVTTFAYNLISLHHDVMWYIILILCLVYWVLYKILKDFLWSVFNKQEGYLTILQNSMKLVNLQIFFFYVGFKFYRYIIKRGVKMLHKIIYVAEDYAINYKGPYLVVWLCFFLGVGYLKHTDVKVIERDELLYLRTAYRNHFFYKDFDYMADISVERFFAYFMYNKTSNAFFFNDRKLIGKNYLKTLSFKHSLRLEYVFGMFPTVIIWYIIVPSMYLLYSNESEINPNVTIKIIGHQWYWTYENTSVMHVKGSKKLLIVNYNYDSIIVDSKNLKLGGKRLLETNKALILPYNMIIRFLITSADVLHSWALPEFGIKVDAVPGRLNQVITSTNNLGVFYGQCSELCGVSHGFMPIKVNVITMKDYYDFFLKRKKS